MWLDVCGCILCRENKVYHLAVWPLSHAQEKTACARHPEALAEAPVFVHLADVSVLTLFRNSVTFLHPNITIIHLIL